MRYTVITKTQSLSQVETELKKVGATDIKIAKLLGQVFCELDENQVKTLNQVPGLILKPIREYKTDQIAADMAPVETLSDVFYMLRSYFNPPLTGVGLTVAVLDSGIRKSHESLQNKVVYEVNFTDSLSASDVFGHGTQVAFVAAGGMHALGYKAGVCPGAAIMNIKVINDEGTSSLA